MEQVSSDLKTGEEIWRDNDWVLQSVCRHVQTSLLYEADRGRGWVDVTHICKAKPTLHCENAVNWRLSVRLECQRTHFVDNLRNSLNKEWTKPSHKYIKIFIYTTDKEYNLAYK